MEVAALIISILSLCISVLFAVLQIRNTKKINDINLEAELSKDIFKAYLTEKFPNAVSTIHFKGRKLTSIAPLQNALNGLRKELKFFKYSDNAFFVDLKNKTQALEDYIVNNEGRSYNAEDQGEVMNTIITQMRGIYELLKKKYTNG